MKIKRVIAALLCAAMAVGVGSCGTVEKESDEVVTISWYVPGDKQEGTAKVVEEANKIIEPAIGAKLDLIFVDTGAYTEKMNMMLSSQEVFDLCFTGFVNPYETTAKKGAYLALDEMLEQTPDLKASIPEWLWDAAKVSGEIYAVPNYQVCSGYMTSFVTNELIEECGLDIESVKKPEDLEPLLAKIKEVHPEMYPWRTASGITVWSNDKETITQGIYIDVDDDSLTAKIEYEAPDALDGIKTIRSWYEKGYIRGDVASAGDDNIDYLNGKYGIFQSTYKPGVEAEIKIKLKKDVTQIKLGEPYVTKQKCVAAMTAVSRTSKNPEKALKLIELMNTNKELYNLICYGIEGVHYEKLDDTYVRLNQEAGYFVNASWKFGNQFNAYLLEGAEPDIWEKTIEMNDTAKKSPLLGFTFDSAPVSSEIAQVSAVTSEYGALTNGSRDYNEFYEEYKSRLKAAGIEKLRDEVQRQLDEYKKTLN